MDEDIAALSNTLGVEPDAAAQLLRAHGSVARVLEARAAMEQAACEAAVARAWELLSLDRRKAMLRLLEADAAACAAMTADVGAMRRRALAQASPVDRLAALGYTRERAEAALRRANHDENEAALLLLCDTL